MHKNRGSKSFLSQLQFTAFPSSSWKNMSVASCTIAGGHHPHHDNLTSHSVSNFSSTSSSCYHRCNFPIMIRSISTVRPLSFILNRNSVAAAVSSSSSTRNISSSTSNDSGFTWDDVFQISQQRNVSSDLSGFFQKIKSCNRGRVNSSTSIISYIYQSQMCLSVFFIIP